MKEKTTAALREAFPHGHPDFIGIMVDQMQLHNDKNHDYARGGDPLGNFRRVSAMLKLWPGFPFDTPEGLAFIYALKQVDAEAWAMCQGGANKVEGFSGRTGDQAVYANIRECIRREQCQVKNDADPFVLASEVSPKDVPPGVFIKTGTASPSPVGTVE